jgi:alkylation response protein AidB-like acyl-CoA dehydrogenase
VDAAVDYAHSRTVFGQALATKQAIQFMIARMQARVHTARLAWHQAARLRDRGKPFKTEAAIAKLTASDAAMDNARDATQIFGGNGFMNEYPVARHYRDSKILEVGEGTTEVQLLVIARALGLA